MWDSVFDHLVAGESPRILQEAAEPSRVATKVYWGWAGVRYSTLGHCLIGWIVIFLDG